MHVHTKVIITVKVSSGLILVTTNALVTMQVSATTGVCTGNIVVIYHTFILTVSTGIYI